MKILFARSCVSVALLAVLLPFSALAAPTPEAISLVRKFVAEELHGNLDALADFDLASLAGHPLYGAPGSTFDADDCNLVRALFDVLYAEALPGLALPAIGTGRAYRGDTLNTFHTLLGRPIPDQPGRFTGLERHRPSDDLRARAAAFHRTYHTLGNLAPLPNRSLGRLTFNTYRGTHPEWRDAFPAFLQNLRLALLADSAADPTLCRLVELNAEAFREFRAPDGLARFAQRLDLDDYVEPATGLPIPHYAPNAHFLPQSDADYLASADRYLAIAPVLIQRRAQRMIVRLRRLLPNGHNQEDNPQR
ncbi:MAG: hypothetical protein KBC66_02055 [Kiritimatiellae bacterium]|nr:hypothetical protein [Kiritimatiellia bacterium]NLD89897.1 hypothetical protein [Lentisphaerota bacterium]HOU20678.1 hypothetical protein [Kiritimatiellia bacterium]HQQ59970.1 hypothetical protein [Kiritimatiellia bacterium]